MPKSRYFFELLSHFTSNELHAEKLREFTTAEGQEELYDYAFRPRRTCFEIMTDFSPLRVPVAYVLDLFPAMKWREFSIASIDPMQIDILVGVVTYKTKLKTPRHGVGTHYLASLAPNHPGNDNHQFMI